MSRSHFLLVASLATAFSAGDARASVFDPVPEGVDRLTLAAQADADHRRALAAMRRGDYAMAYCLWRDLADGGDAEAQYSIGWMFHNGYGLRIDELAAEQWWRQAAEQGHLDAMFALGNLYSLGGGPVERNFGAALDYLVRAAGRGHQDSRMVLRELAALEVPDLRRRIAELMETRAELFGGRMQVNGERVNLRSGPGTGYRVVAVLNDGQPLVELLRRGEWVKVGVAGKPLVAWIWAPLVAKPAPEAQVASGD